MAGWGGDDASGGTGAGGAADAGGTAGAGGMTGHGGTSAGATGGASGTGGLGGLASGGTGTVAAGGSGGTATGLGGIPGTGGTTGTGGSGPPFNLTLSLFAGLRGGPGSADGTGAGARFASLWGIASDGAGNIYVADEGNRTIRKVAVATGVVTTLAGSVGVFGSTDGNGGAALFSTVLGVASDGAGNLFVADFNNSTIRKVELATGAVTTLAGSPGSSGVTDGVGAAARFRGPSGLASDGAGNLFVTDGNMVRKIVIATGAVTTLAGSIGRGSADGAGDGAAFYNPRGLISDGAGNLFVADEGNYTIRKVVIATGVVTTYAGSPGITGSANGTGAAASFNYPADVASDGSGNLYVADRGNCALRKIVMASAVVTTLAGAAGCSGVLTDGPGTTARLGEPAGVAYDGAGNLFVTESTTVRKVVLATGVVTTLAGAYSVGSADGSGSAARFGYPTGMARDGAGNLYIADQGNRTLRKVLLATGIVSTFAGSQGLAGSVDGIGSAARFNSPWGLATDGSGNLLVADQVDGTIRGVVLATSAVTTLAGSPTVRAIGTPPAWADGIGAAAQFASPSGATSDGAGNIYVADTGNMTIRKVVVATGAVTTLAGSPNASGSVDGTGAAARFEGPWGIASDGSGNLFVADWTTVRKVVIATGAVSTLAGSPGSVGWTDATGAAARFRSLRDLAVDGTGNLLVVDSGNNT